MGKDKGLGKKRFSMVKRHHCGTLVEAVEKNLADEKLVPLCNFIAGTENYYTSSGCAGRIILLQLPKGECKREASFIRRWHRKISAKETMQALGEETRGEVWMKMEPFILHLGTNSLENAGRILRVMGKAGVKRGGIIVAKQGKFLVEMQGTQEMSVPLKQGSKVLVQPSYLKWLVEKANSKLEETYKRLERLEKECRAEMQ